MLELLVVLAIAGLLASVALPQLYKTAESLERNSQRRDLKSAIEGLGYKAYASGKAISLADAIAAKGVEDRLPVPAGWQVRVLQPVRYADNGACSGGMLVISEPGGQREAFRLAPPKCMLEPMELPE